MKGGNEATNGSGITHSPQGEQITRRLCLHQSLEGGNEATNGSGITHSP